MGWFKSKCGGATVWSNSDTRETWYEGRCGGATTYSSPEKKETWFKGKSGGATIWTSSKRDSSKGMKPFMTEDDD